MWTTENQRRGFQQCTPLGYALVSSSYLLLVGGGLLLVILGGLILLGKFPSPAASARAVAGLWIPVACLVAGWLAQRGGWAIARRRGFVHDYATDSCRWNGMPTTAK